MANAILPPSSSPAGMLLIALMRSPAHAHRTRGLTDIWVPSLRTSPKSSFATKREEKWLSYSLKVWHCLLRKGDSPEDVVNKKEEEDNFKTNWTIKKVYECSRSFNRNPIIEHLHTWNTENTVDHSMQRPLCLPKPPARSDSWNTEASTITPIPSEGGKKNPKSKRTRPKENPAKGPAIATFRRSSRFGTIFRILVIAPKEPICHQNSSLDFQYIEICSRGLKRKDLLVILNEGRDAVLTKRHFPDLGKAL